MMSVTLKQIALFLVSVSIVLLSACDAGRTNAINSDSSSDGEDNFIANDDAIQFSCEENPDYRSDGYYQSCEIKLKSEEKIYSFTTNIKKFHYPVWSSVAKKYVVYCEDAYSSRDEKTGDICLFDFENESIVFNLSDLMGQTSDDYEFLAPRWLPNDALISAKCTYGYKDIPGICLLDPTGEHPIRNITKAAGLWEEDIGIHSWSPDGKQILFGCNREDLCLLDKYGENAPLNLSESVGFDTGFDYHGVWSPDSRYISYKCQIVSSQAKELGRTSLVDRIRGDCVARADGVGPRFNLTATFTAAGYEGILRKYEDGAYKLFSCPDGQAENCTLLGNVFELVETLEEFQEYDIHALCTQPNFGSIHKVCDNYES